MTIGEKLEQNRGFAKGFDFMRVVLALAVVTSHSFWIAAINTTLMVTRPSWFPLYVVVPSFFALSGFLIVGSAERLSLGNFLLNRGLRIFPALSVEIIASAFILGPIFTTLTLGQYFSSPQTWHYMTNVIGLINYHLPGVFEHLPMTGIVNISLWTVPFEMITYCIMTVLILSGLVRRRGAILLLAVLWGLAGITVELLRLAEGGTLTAKIFEEVFIGRGPRIIIFGLMGMAAYQHRSRIPYSKVLFAASIVACLAIWAFAPVKGDSPMIAALSCLPIVYITLFLGVTNLPELPFFRRGDYSYGIYLYGFPMQQAVKSLFPAVTNGWVLTLLAAPLIAVFAAFSWHFIEKPILKLRKNFSFIARRRLEEPAPAAPRADAPVAAPSIPAAE
jgi:peptidoglycan/LPS O-acetylase OafA/YrhL